MSATTATQSNISQPKCCIACSLTFYQPKGGQQGRKSAICDFVL